MSVEFTVRASDLRQATQELTANRGKYSSSDFVDILVSESAALLRAVGTESEAPITGAVPGSVRVPLRILGKINEALSTQKEKEVTFHCEPGVIQIGKFSVKHPEIQLHGIEPQGPVLPINLSTLDTLAWARLFPAREIDEHGMRARVEDAESARRSAIAEALLALQVLEVGERQLNHFVDCHIQEAVKRLSKKLEAA